ncbi:MAG: SDR family NAD(P)-dependent oxidoreductase [Beijerinckiaceae bacterium]|jgi:NAD(P)-dependent dehydrogenase (short-subunit alcohol dehydrogenase family)
MSRLAGKSALVFGAGPNIGGTTAYFMAREGAQVLVCDANREAAEATCSFIRSRGFVAFPACGDATQESDVQAAVDGLVDRTGRIDVVMNMAGKVHWSSVLDMDVAAWREAIVSFPTAGLLTTKLAARRMIDLGVQGSIIHLLSTTAHFGQAEASAYATAKAGLLNFARSAAMELAEWGVRVNTITPCSVEHQLWTKMKSEAEAGKFTRVKGRPQYSRDDYLKNIPLGRFPRASDIAWAAVFLASDESSAITGIDIPVDGGLRHKYPTWRPGDFTGANIEDYVSDLHRLEYGEDVGLAFPDKRG